MSSTGKEGLLSLIRRFIHRRKLRNYAPRYIELTEIHLRDFASYLKGQRLREIRSVSKENLVMYIHFLRDDFRLRRGGALSEYAVYSRWRSILLFFAFLTQEGFLLYNPTLTIERPHPYIHHPRQPLTVEEVELLLSQPDMKTKTGIRDRAILELFYSTGIRRGELLGLDLFDVDLHDTTLRIRNAKFCKERVVPLGEHAAYYLTHYLDQVRSCFVRKDSRIDALFVTCIGTPLDSQTLQVAMKKHIDRSGIKKKISLHVLRHSFATHLLEGGADIFSIQELLGHKKVETTQIYAKASLENLKEVHRNCHPRGKRV
jgi:integrase/recombinase XerD